MHHSFDSIQDMFRYLHQQKQAALAALARLDPSIRNIQPGECAISIRPDVGVIIFYEILPLDVEEDGETVEQDSLPVGYCFTKAYSPLCPDGEKGDVHLTSIHKVIPRDLFEACQALNWDVLRCKALLQAHA